jgi:hypothetical protein
MTSLCWTRANVVRFTTERSTRPRVSRNAQSERIPSPRCLLCAASKKNDVSREMTKRDGPIEDVGYLRLGIQTGNADPIQPDSHSVKYPTRRPSFPRTNISIRRLDGSQHGVVSGFGRCPRPYSKISRKSQLASRKMSELHSACRRVVQKDHSCRGSW